LALTFFLLVTVTRLFLLLAVPALAIGADFLFVFMLFFRGMSLLKKTVRPVYSPWCRLMAKPTNRRVSRMMAKSSRVAITRIRAVEAAVAMSASG
jgi:hypothetical protein